MTHIVSKIPVTPENATYFSALLYAISNHQRGLTRALRRILDWICEEGCVKFTLFPGVYTMIDPRDGQEHEYFGAEYNACRRETRDVRSYEDLENNAGLPPISDHQFQLRMIHWAQGKIELFEGWCNVAAREGFSIWREVKYVVRKDTRGIEFYVPEFSVHFASSWEEHYTSKQKHTLAELLLWWASCIEDAWQGDMVFLEPDEIDQAQALFDNIVFDNHMSDSKIYTNDPAAVG